MSLPLFITRMQERDLPGVMAIERQSFPTPWSVNTYRYEISQNELGRYYVVRRRDVEAANAHDVIAYGGFWNMGDTAHITTIATHPQWRRRHLAVWLMLHMMDVAAGWASTSSRWKCVRGMGAAQQLYHSLGFAEVGVRRRYYPPTKTQPPKTRS
ncbi:MAG: GNAT family N-acetyltransferase [Caldilineaceae bacterium]